MTKSKSSASILSTKYPDGTVLIEEDRTLEYLAFFHKRPVILRVQYQNMTQSITGKLTLTPTFDYTVTTADGVFSYNFNRYEVFRVLCAAIPVLTVYAEIY